MQKMHIGNFASGYIVYECILSPFKRSTYSKSFTDQTSSLVMVKYQQMVRVSKVDTLIMVFRWALSFCMIKKGICWKSWAYLGCKESDVNNGNKHIFTIGTKELKSRVGGDRDPEIPKIPGNTEVRIPKYQKFQNWNFQYYRIPKMSGPALSMHIVNFPSKRAPILYKHTCIH